MCVNADVTAKVYMAIIGKAEEPRCFRARAFLLKYFSQTNAWSDSKTFRSWWHQVFLPFIRRWTHLPVLLLMDACSSHDDLIDDRGQVTVITYPPNCTSVHQPMDTGKLHQRASAHGHGDHLRDLVDLQEGVTQRQGVHHGRG